MTSEIKLIEIPLDDSRREELIAILGTEVTNPQVFLKNRAEWWNYWRSNPNKEERLDKYDGFVYAVSKVQGSLHALDAGIQVYQEVYGRSYEISRIMKTLNDGIEVFEIEWLVIK